MGKYEVTQGQWETVMGNDDRLARVNSGTNYGRGANRPMYYVSWYDALVFCNKLSISEGLTPAYSINGSTDPSIWGPAPTASDALWDVATIVAGSTGYRLPTEAQWEYACRAGTATLYSYGDTENGDYMWYIGNNSGTAGDATYGSKAVGTRLSNTWGLYDMHGNVFEWCWDWYGTYSTTGLDNPLGASSGSDRVLRGGSWISSAAVARSAYRVSISPNDWDYLIGFRLARP